MFNSIVNTPRKTFVSDNKKVIKLFDITCYLNYILPLLLAISFCDFIKHDYSGDKKHDGHF